MRPRRRPQSADPLLFLHKTTISWVFFVHPLAPRPRPQLPTKDHLLDMSLIRTHTHAPGSADSSGLRPHAPTLKERSRLNSPVGTKRVAAQTANVCTVRGLLCDGPASSVSSNLSHSFEFPDPNLRPRRCSTPKSHSGADWDSENRILNPKWCHSESCAAAKETQASLLVFATGFFSNAI